MSDKPEKHLNVPNLEDVPFALLLGIEITSVERGSAVLSLNVRQEFKQNHGVVHGGVIAALIDTAAAYSVATLLNPGEATTTIEITIHYLEAVVEGGISAHARVRRAGGQVFVIDIEVRNEDGLPIATGITSFLRRKSR